MKRLFLNGLAGRPNGLGWLSQAVEQLGYEKFAAPDGLPKSFNYMQIKNALGNPATEPSAENTIAVGTFAPWYLSNATMNAWLQPLDVHHYWQGHVLWSETFATLLKTLDYKQIVILRDPRVVIGNMLWEDEKLPNFFKLDFADWSIQQRLSCLCEGGHLPKANVTLAPFKDFYLQMLAWQHDENTLLLHLEAVQSTTTLKDLLVYLECEEHIQKLEMLSKNAATQQDWHHHLDTSTVQYIETYCATFV